MILLALLLQAATVAPITRATAAPPERFSILLPDCPTAQGRDVVVCGSDTATTQRLPYPQEVVPDHGVPSNPLMNGVGALAAETTPCAATMKGCLVGFGPPIMPMIAAGIQGVRNALQDRREAKARARDGDRRQPIDLSDAPAGRVEP